jgi:hypothetical protein
MISRILFFMNVISGRVETGGIPTLGALCAAEVSCQPDDNGSGAALERALHGWGLETLMLSNKFWS